MILRRKGTTLVDEKQQPVSLFIVEQFGFNHYLNGEIFTVLDILKSSGANGFRVFCFWPFGLGREQEPYHKRGSSFDLERFNEEWFAYQKEWVEYALKKGLVVQVELFDPCGLKKHWGCARYHPYFQIIGDDYRRLADTKNKRLLAYQQLFVRKMVQTLPFPNVIWGAMNEFTGDPEWHYAMDRSLRKLAPDNLISSSEESCNAIDDPNVDIWAIHTGKYDFQTGTPHVREDIQHIKGRLGSLANQCILGWSTDGFMPSGKFRENPQDMIRLAQDIKRNNLPFFAFLDQKAYNSSNQEKGVLSKLNVDTYQAIASVFKPTQFVDDEEELPEGMLSRTFAWEASYTHPQAFYSQHGRAVRANTTNGFLFFGNYKSGYPKGTLTGVFSVYIDNNTHDDAYIAILDVVKNRNQVVASRLLRRTEFPAAGRHIDMVLEFESDDPSAKYELRVLYLGYAYLAVRQVTVNLNP